MLSKYKHISFDLDGTLVHTIPEYRHKLLPKVVKKLGGTIKEEYSIDRFWFESGRDKTIQEDFNINPSRFWSLFRTLDAPEKRSLHTYAYDDAERSLKKIKKSGKILSIITGAPHLIAEMEIKKLNGVSYDLYLSIHDNGYKGKPNPKSFDFALNKLAVDKKETLYIGNSNEDAYYAKNAGVDFIYLERKEHEFDLKNYAIATIHSLDALFD